MVSKVIDAQEQSLIDNGSAQVTIKKEWLGLIGGLDKDGNLAKKITVALVRSSKHGFHLAVYNPEFQQK